MELTGSRVKLREFKISDLDAVSEILTDDEIANLAGFEVKENIIDILYTLSKFANSDEKNMIWAITLIEEDIAIGWIELHSINDNNNDIYEMGFVLNRAYWGQGIVREGIMIGKEYCFSKLRIKKILCSHFVSNISSEKTIKACGFKYLKKDENMISYILKNEVV